jgi:3D (Asp-Asp-Asp) domain-containing protein
MIREISLIVTAYVIRPDHGCVTNLNHTALMNRPAHVGTVAVDPRRFKAGTRFDIPGYGRGVAEDTGSAIVGRTIDVAVTSCSEAFHWGRRTLLVRVSAPVR